MKKVIIYTDGACRGNGKEDAIGGYGIVLIYNGKVKECKKAFKNTTNNKMELQSAVDALKMLKEPCEVELYSDSAYLINCFNQKWLKGWKKNGWRTSNKQQVKNKDLWEELDISNKTHKITWIKVKGHSDNEYNNRCDQLANEAMDALERE